MERIVNQSHNKYTFLYSSSRLFERASYYGLRSLIVLYMIGESLKMSTGEALKVYGWFMASIVFSQILGALLGDLVIGNKKSILIGGILQAMGTFCLCIPSTAGLYLGIALVVLGTGFYTPNIISHFGKLYLNKTKLLDSGFTIFYLAVNIGSFLGVFLIGYLGQMFGWNIGFMIAGVLMLLSLIFPLLSKDKDKIPETENHIGIGQRIIKISIAFVLVALFWALYEVSYARYFDLQEKFSEYSTLNISQSVLSALDSAFTIPVSIIAIILWSYFYNNQFVKLTIGFLFGAVSYGILFLIPETPSEQHLIIYMISLLFLSISEIHIAPIIHSILTQYTNPKYLAIIVSLAFVPTRLFSFLVGLFSEELYSKPILALKIGMIAMSVIGIGLVIYTLISKKLSTAAVHNQS
ncbi:MFS transporter [Leptobacterium flavescens]|uniref:MFS transporter n=1 Tax=Leptobacterium flavescens TaxID=472055 RepID=A0A6P0UPJ0_9FLAO|nr:MFS transporter [Leptobacterium flavescens]NER15085.1 MFS transporter [Leptobacterium flavescens]